MAEQNIILATLLLVLLILIVVWVKKRYYRQHNCSVKNPCNVSWALTHYTNQQLWFEHVVYTREYLISRVKGDPDDVVAEKVARLIANQEHIGNFLGNFWGPEAGAEVTRLLTEHITIADEIVTAALNEESTDVLVEAWRDNSRRIAEGLANLSKGHIAQDPMEKMMYEHLDLTLQEFKALNDGGAAIGEYDAVIAQALGMGRTLSEALAAQFGF